MKDDEVLELCVGVDIELLSAQRKGEPWRPILERFTRSVVAKGRDEGLEDAERAVLAEHLEDPQEETDAAYDRAIDDAAGAVRALKSGSVDG